MDGHIGHGHVDHRYASDPLLLLFADPLMELRHGGGLKLLPFMPYLQCPITIDLQQQQPTRGRLYKTQAEHSEHTSRSHHGG